MLADSGTFVTTLIVSALVAKCSQAAAVEAQKAALVRRTEVQKKAQAVYTDLDRQIVDLEKLYATATRGLDKERTGQLLSIMKVTRQSAAILFLAYEQQDYETVLAGEGKAREVIASTRGTLQAARPGTGGKGGLRLPFLGR